MEALDKKYQDQLDVIAQHIQASEYLAAYLEEEEDEYYKTLQALFEPHIQAIYEEIAAIRPLQLIAFENALLDEKFEGLFLPRILAYSALRGQINEHYKYILPQNHFKEILLTICNSSNFENISHRIGQSVQVGFALSSDIWITNILDRIKNKRIIAFLLEQKKIKYRDLRERRIIHTRFSKQLRDHNFHTANFPKSFAELKTNYAAIKNFLKHRVTHDLDNSSLFPYIKEMLEMKEFLGHDEFTDLVILIANYMELDKPGSKALAGLIDTMRNTDKNFEKTYFELLDKYLDEYQKITAAGDARILSLLDTKKNDDLTSYYKLMEIVHGKGYMHDNSIEAVKEFYYHHEGVSEINTCIRKSIFAYFNQLMSNLPETDYTTYFELNKTFTQYIDIFTNEHFNQKIKGLSLSYIKKLIKFYPDKRGKDYQDIKKFVNATFLDLGFMNQKSLVELFKTRRKKKPQA